MRTRHWVFMLFFVCSALFVVGSILERDTLVLGSNFILVPVLLLLYRLRSGKIFYPIVTALLLMYIRDIFLHLGYADFPGIIMVSLLGGLFLMVLCALSMLRKTKIDLVEYFSFLIMYSFLIFVFFFMADMVPELVADYEIATYIYLLLLVLFLGISFTAYLLKSHYGTLWLMLAGASLLFSEVSLFFKLYIIEDYSVNIFFPVFHIFAYYALIEHGRTRREQTLFPYLWNRQG